MPTAAPPSTDEESAPVALVTGAAAGLGRATAEALARDGHRVVLVDRDADGAARAAAGCASPALAVEADVTDAAAADRMVTATLERFGRLDVLVNNAGLPASHVTATISDADWSAMLDVNLSSALRCARAAYPALAAAPAAAIVNMSSMAAVAGMSGRAAYSAAKAGLMGLTRALAIEWAPDGIRVNAVAPGYVRTAGFDERVAAGVAQQLEADVPLGRLGRPEDIASVIRFLASGEAGYLTGQTIVVDGGVSIRASS